MWCEWHPTHHMLTWCKAAQERLVSRVTNDNERRSKNRNSDNQHRTVHSKQRSHTRVVHVSQQHLHAHDSGYNSCSSMLKVRDSKIKQLVRFRSESSAFALARFHHWIHHSLRAQLLHSGHWLGQSKSISTKDGTNQEKHASSSRSAHVNTTDSSLRGCVDKRELQHV